MNVSSKFCKISPVDSCDGSNKKMETKVQRRLFSLYKSKFLFKLVYDRIRSTGFQSPRMYDLLRSIRKVFPLDLFCPWWTRCSMNWLNSWPNNCSHFQICIRFVCLVRFGFLKLLESPICVRWTSCWFILILSAYSLMFLFRKRYKSVLMRFTGVISVLILFQKICFCSLCIWLLSGLNLVLTILCMPRLKAYRWVALGSCFGQYFFFYEHHLFESCHKRYVDDTYFRFQFFRRGGRFSFQA